MVDPQRLVRALSALETLPEPAARATAREALSTILDFHREGIERLSGRLAATPEGRRSLEAAAEDEVVASLLLLHGLHPLALATRVSRAVDHLRAQERNTGRAGGAPVEILSIDPAAIRVRVGGGERWRRAIERALQDAAPEVERIEVLGTTSDLIPVARLRATGGPSAGPHSRCDLCGEALAQEHAHLFDVERRSLSCACSACGFLFDGTAGKLRRVSPRALQLEGFCITEAQWQALQVPVGLAFFSRSSSRQVVVAAYPGPAGALESAVPPAAWADLVANNGALAGLEADTSALLVHRLGKEPRHYLLSIDHCYHLTGIVRSRWQGMSGGDGPMQAVDHFLDRLQVRQP
jgi:hypothetical protein